MSRDGGSTVAALDTDLPSGAGTAVGAVALPGGARLVARQLPDGVHVWRSDTGRALSWTAGTSLAGTGGGLAADRAGRLYVPLLRDGRAVVGVSTDGGRSFSVRGPGLTARSVPRLAVDTAGGVLLTAVRPDGGVVLTRSPAGGGRWSAPVRVDGTGRPAGAVSSSVVAADPGRTAVAWYGRVGGGWTPRVAVTVDGASFVAADASRTVASADPAQTAASTPPALAVDARGHLLVAWTATTGPLPGVLVARQAAGPSLLRGRPAAARPVAGAGADGAGDARFPLVGRVAGSNRAGLDLTGTSLSLRPDGVLEIRLGLADASRLSAPEGTSSVRYLTRWELDGRQWYAAATTSVDGPPVFSAGQLGAGQVLVAPSASGPTARAHSYAAGAAVTGRVEASRLVLHVPSRLVGGVRPGSVLHSVTSSTLVGAADPATAAQPPVAVDASPAYDTVLGRPSLVDGLVTPLRPARLLDTRRTGGAVRPGQPRGLQVTGRGGVPTGATAVLLQVTALAPAADGDLRVGATAPLPVSRGRTTGSLVLAAVGPGGRLALGATSATHVLVDVVGAVRDGAGVAYAPRPGRRLLDTRSGPPLTGSPRRIAAPADARAVLLSVTVPAARRSGVVEVWGAGSRPAAGGAPAEPGRTLTTTVLAEVAPDGTLALATTAGAAHAVVDLVGVSAGTAGSRTYPVPPATLVDTRAAMATRPGQVVIVRTAGRLPATARQAVLQVTAYGATSAGYLTVWPGGARPDLASLRLVPGRTTTGLVVVDLPANRAVSVYISAGTPDVRVDLVGATHP